MNFHRGFLLKRGNEGEVILKENGRVVGVCFSALHAKTIFGMRGWTFRFPWEALGSQLWL